MAETLTAQSARKYIRDILSCKILACKWVKLAMKRHETDLKRVGKRGFPYHFDEDLAENPIYFIENFCVHVKGHMDKKPLLLEPWQKAIIWIIFGWVDDEGYRRFNNVFIEVAKKNGKSTLVAGIGLYMTALDEEGGAEVYSAATTKDQAKIVFKEYARAMVIKSPELKKVFKPFATSIVDAETETSTFRALSADVDSLDGKNVHCAIIDEYHAHKTDGVYKIMSDGMASRKQPITIIITTAGFDPDVPCVDEEAYVQRILSGRTKNESYFGIIYTLDEKDDWRTKKNWGKANPCLGISKQKKAMDRDFQKALDMPAEQSKFKNKHLNIWTKNKTGWIRDDDWQAVEEKYTLEEMAGKKCYGAIDLAYSGDTGSYTLTFAADERGKFRQYTRIFLPEWEIKDREDRERFEWRQMAAEGFVTLTPGRLLDYDFIQVQLEADLEMFDLREVAYDPYNASQFVTNLIALGIEKKLVEYQQGWKLISPATKDFSKKVTEKLVAPWPNPVLAWMISNTAIQTDARGNQRPVKFAATKHIDGSVTSLMSLDRCVRNVKKPSVYSKRGMLTVG